MKSIDRTLKSDILAACVVLALAGFAYWATTDLPAESREPADIGPRFLPTAVLAVIVALALFLILKSVWQAKRSARATTPAAAPDTPAVSDEVAAESHVMDDASQAQRHYVAAVVTLALLVLYIVLLAQIGAILPSFAFLFGVLLLFTRNWWKSLVYSAVYTAVLYVLFIQVLGVRNDRDVVEALIRSAF